VKYLCKMGRPICSSSRDLYVFKSVKNHIYIYIYIYIYVQDIGHGSTTCYLIKPSYWDVINILCKLCPNMVDFVCK